MVLKDVLSRAYPSWEEDVTVQRVPSHFTSLYISAYCFLVARAAVVALPIRIGISVIGSVPIKCGTAVWQLSAPPSDWKVQAERVERFCIVGVWAAVLSFACMLAAVAHGLAVHWKEIGDPHVPT